MKQYLIIPTNGDVFIHTWDIHHAGSRLDHHNKAQSTLDIPLEEYINLFIKPKNFIIENYDEFKHKYGNTSTPAMYYSIMKSNELVQMEQQQYDIVYRIRMDCFFDNIISTDLLIKENTLYVACNCSPEKYIHNVTTDIFALADQTTMNIYANAFTFWLNNRHLQSEQVLHNWLLENHINVEWSDMRFKVLDHWTKNRISAHASYE